MSLMLRYASSSRVLARVPTSKAMCHGSDSIKCTTLGTAHFCNKTLAMWVLCSRPSTGLGFRV
jgi:hypothetical protein